jgi:hypothetical protein
MAPHSRQCRRAIILQYIAAVKASSTGITCGEERQVRRVDPAPAARPVSAPDRSLAVRRTAIGANRPGAPDVRLRSMNRLGGLLGDHQVE